jgi:hypothetical protein
MPVGIGFVVLIDEGGNEVARALSARDGRFSLRAPGAGTYRLRSERIGYRATVSQPLEIPPQATVSHTLRVTAIPIVLSAVEVPGEDRCRISPDRAAETGVVWEEIRKALAATAWDGTQELARYRTYNFERTRNPNRRSITGERGRVLAGVARQPYHSRPAELLARQGYVVEFRDSTSYDLPDPGVLMHDSFLASHCFRVVRDPAGRPGQVGLAFESTSGRSVADVTGALWLDEETSQLTTLEVGYTQLPHGLEDERVGGTIEFLMLPSGAWIVSRWELRTPMIRLGPSANPFDRGPRQVATIRGFRDFGGEVLEITTREGDKILPATLAHVTGTVYDSSKAAPLRGAFLSVLGTDFSAISDRAGRYELAVPLEGDYLVTLNHPWLDSIAVPELEQRLRFHRDTTQLVDFAIPHVAGAVHRICGGRDPHPLGRVIVGVVRREGSASPVTGATVTARWQSIAGSSQGYIVNHLREQVRTDDAGFFAVCDVPAGRSVTLHAAKSGAASREASVLFPYLGGENLLMAWDRRPGQPYEYQYPAPKHVWKLDLTVGPERSSGVAAVPLPRSSLSGIVVDNSTGQPIGNALIHLNGRDSTVSRDDGTFAILDAAWLPEANAVAVRRLGYQPWVLEIGLHEDHHHVELSIALEPQAVALDPVEVTAELMEQYLTDVGFYRRQQFNPGGHFMGREEIEQRLGRVNYVEELLTGVVGVQVGDPVAGGVGHTLRFARGKFSFRDCSTPLIFVDGMRIEITPHGGALAAVYNTTLSEVVRPEEVYAIEVYRTPSQIPVQYGGAQSACGVLLIWTRRGR